MKRHLKSRRPKSIVETLEPRVAPATFTVTTLSDTGTGSLRQAILDANATPALDTIVFKAGLTGTLAMATGQFAVTKPLTIKGPGSAKVIINAGGMSGIFEVDDASTSTDSPFSISGLSLVSGSDGVGGAIASSESLKVLNCTFSGNAATAGSGGAIFASGNLKVSITGSQFSGNSSTLQGGGVFAVAGKGVSIVKSVFTGNSAGNDGGGLFLGLGSIPLPTAKVMVLNSTMVNNSATLDGGGLEINMETGDSAVVQNSLISGNLAGKNGGGFYFDQGKLTMTNTVLSANRAELGGGMFLDRSESVTINASKILANTATDTGATGGGGGIVFQKDSLDLGIYKLNASTVAGNTSAGAGGGIWLSEGASLTVTGGVIHGNRADFDGGGIFTNGLGSKASPLTLKNVTISENVAPSASGGGLAAVGDGVVSVTGTKFLNNQASSSGGAIFRSASTITVQNSLFQGNSALVGGGFQIADAGTATFTSVKVLQNNAGVFGGGFTNALAGSTLVLSKSLVSGNYSGGSAGGGIVSPGTTLQKTVVTGNIAKTTNGGLAAQGGNATISADSKVTGNIAPAVPNM